MAEDQSGPPASGSHDDQPGQPPAKPLGGRGRPAEPPPGYGPDPWSQAPTAPLPAGQPAVPGFAAVGPPREALAGFWRRLAAAFLDWVLVGVLAAAIGELFGVDVPSPPSAGTDAVPFQPAPGPFVLVALVYFTYFHATSAGQSIGNKILEIRVLVSNLSAIVFFLGYLWMLWEPRKRTWHDMVADSLVVRASAYPPGEFGRPAPAGTPEG